MAYEVMFRFNFSLKKHWPKLAWVCVFSLENDSAEILHGPMLEVSPDWAVEAVWEGVFEKGDFDKTDLVFGSGIRKRDNQIIFVSSATGIDRLWHTQCNAMVYVSNSLPAILGVSGLALLEKYRSYARDIASIENNGLYSYVKSIPTNGSDLNIVYYNNIVWNGESLQEIAKPDKTPQFSDYRSYENYLKKASGSLGGNAQSSSRRFPVRLLVGLSTGYDSVACAVVAKYAGCKDAVSIIDSTSLWRGADSGAQIASCLALACKCYRHDPLHYKSEVAVWAGSGNPGGRNLSLFEYFEPLTFFFSGGYGDTVWERKQQGLDEPVGDYDELVSEFRLIQGIFMTQVPWWGIRHAAEIQKLNLLEEMKPWTLGTNYDRPIARRLAEEAGVPRSLFGINKKNTASNRPFWWPSTAEADRDLRAYLSSLGIKPMPGFMVWLSSVFYNFVKLVNANVLFFVDERKKWKPWLKSPVRHLLFIWANHSLRDKYYR